MTDRRIAIVGAGLAGATAARELARAGHAVVLFDKARGIGGRMATRRHETGAFDHGAQYFTARTAAFQTQVESWCERDLAAPWEARIVELEAGKTRPEESPRPRYVGVPKMGILARDLTTDLEVHCARRIDSTRRGKAGFLLETTEGERFDGFDALVLATPAPQTLDLLPEGSEALAERIRAVEIDPCQAVLATFSSPVAADFDAAFVRDSALAWVARGASRPGRPQAENWVLHGSAEWSRDHVDVAPERVGGLLLEAFSGALDRPLPDPLHLSSHRWLYARTRKPLGEDSLWDAASGLGVCGDWLRGARVEDAFSSGLALAARMRAELG